MLSSIARHACFAVLLCVALCRTSLADPPASTSVPDATSCQVQIDRASTLVPHMPDGAEKAAAWKELQSARTELANGNAESCGAHVRNAMQAYRAHDAR